MTPMIVGIPQIMVFLSMVSYASYKHQLYFPQENRASLRLFIFILFKHLSKVAKFIITIRIDCVRELKKGAPKVF